MIDKNDLTLYDYWRSSASYRVRIALNLKGLAYAQKTVHLINHGGEHRSDAHRALNPQQSVPVLVQGEIVIRQSLAILEYLEEAFPSTLSLLPAGRADRAQARALAELVACDIHPLNNLRVVQYLEREYGIEQPARETWMRHWMSEGFRAFEALLATSRTRGDFCLGNVPSIADCCLVPQVYNASRFKLDLTPFSNIRRINEACLALPAFDAARPEKQPDAC